LNSLKIPKLKTVFKITNLIKIKFKVNLKNNKLKSKTIKIFSKSGKQTNSFYWKLYCKW